MLGDHGFTSKVLPYLPSTHVPFMVAGPTIKPSRNDAIVLNIDLAPTIFDMTELYDQREDKDEMINLESNKSYKKK